jgi:Cu/Ag efflux pump CusA
VAKIGVFMVTHLDQVASASAAQGRVNNGRDLAQGIIEGAALRVRQITTTVAVIIAGLPIM